MKTLALLTALALQLTNLWPHMPETIRTKLTHAAVNVASETPAPTSSAFIADLRLPIRTGDQLLSFGSDTSVLALDRSSATTLYAQQATKVRPIASITKLITALVVLSRHDLEEVVTVPALPAYGPDDELLGLYPGETYRLGDLVRAALISSGNDAADTLAIYDSGNLTKFAAQMNLKMSAWDIAGTRFTNPSGLQDNFASAEALSRIALLALQNPLIREAVTQSTVTITSGAGRTIEDTTTNKLLATGRYYGIKTGYTLSSGQCFLGLTRIQGREVITVILGSSDRFGATEELVNWIGYNYQWL